MTEYLTDIDRAVYYLRQGELIAFPTETVFALGAALSQKEAKAKIFKVKKRALNQPLALLLASVEQLSLVTNFRPPKALVDTFWPGPLTLVLPAFDGTIGVRIPDHEVARSLIERVGEPIIATSANISGEKSCLSSDEVLEVFSGKIPAVLEGQCRYREASTVLSLVDEPTLLRLGSISQEELEKVLGKKILS